jgi:hypothetical protein
MNDAVSGDRALNGAATGQDVTGSGAPRKALQVMFLTGQSDPRSCALSESQARFLAALPVPDEARTQLNFPYDPQMKPYRPVPLLLASWRHLMLFWAIRRRGFGPRHAPAVIEQLEQADRTLVLAGSIGLDILGRLDLPPLVLDRLLVFAFGPVSTTAPDCPIFAVVSRKDQLARWWVGRADAVVGCGHLGYLEDPQVAASCRGVIARLASAARREPLVPRRPDTGRPVSGRPGTGRPST